MQDTSLFFKVYYFNAAPRKVDAAETARNETFQEMSNPSGLLNKHVISSRTQVYFPQIYKCSIYMYNYTLLQCTSLIVPVKVKNKIFT